MKMASITRWGVLILVLSQAMACVDDGASVYIRSAITTEGDDCVLTPGSVVIGSGQIDLAASRGYGLGLVVVNQILSRRDNLMADPSVVQMESYEVSINTPDGSLIGIAGNPSRVLASTAVPAAAGGVPGEAATAFRAIDDTLLQGLIDSGVAVDGGGISLSIVGIGMTGGQSGVETAPFSFPISFCMGCLGVCEGVATEEDAKSCSPGQDSQPYIVPGC